MSFASDCGTPESPQWLRKIAAEALSLASDYGANSTFFEGMARVVPVVNAISASLSSKLVGR